MPQGISFSGLGSGLDTDSIIQQLIDVERRPVRLIQNRQARLEQQKVIVKDINSSLLSLKGTVEKLDKDELFSIVNAASEDAAKVGVQATNEASGGTFSVEVLELAQARSLSSRSYADLDEGLNLSGDIVINGKGIEIEAEDDLIDIQNSINSADAGVSAQILTVSSGDNRLILTAEEVGKSGFDIQDASANNVLQALGFTSSEPVVKNAFANGARTAQFLDDSQAVGSLLNLGSSPSGTITVGDQEIAVDLAADSLTAIRDRINAAAPSGVTAQIVFSDAGGITRFQLEIEGTTNLIDASGVLATLGVFDGDGKIADEIITGAESDQLISTTTAVGSLLGLGSAPAGSVKIGGETVDIDLAADSLTDIQTKINAAVPSEVNAMVTSSTDEEGNAQFRLRIDGTADLVDDGNVLEALGFVVGSNNAFESVAQALTANVGNQEKGAIVHAVGNGAKTDQFSSDSDVLGTLIGSSAAGTITIGDKTVSVDLATDSLTSIRDKINAAAPTGVSAIVNTVGPSSFELQIDGTTDFEDDNGVLQALNVLEEPTTLTADTRFADIVGAGVKTGDTITLFGTNHAGDQVAGSFTISSTSLKIQSLLSTVEQVFGNDVTASVDSSGRIVVTDDQSGSSSLALSLLTNGEGGGNLDLGTLTNTTEGIDARSAELQVGQDALFRINGISLSRSSNTVTDAVNGITLDLKTAEVGKRVNITVTKDDTTELRKNIETFVTDFNSAADLINQQFVLDENTQRGGLLSGDATLLGLQSRLRSVVSSQVEGLAEGFNALVLIGISFDRSGNLTIDDDTLNDALNNNLEEVRQLFVARGSATDDKVEFITTNRRTQPGDYAVNIANAAEKASITGSVELTGGLGADQILTITDRVTGKPANIELNAGDTLDQIVATINISLASDVAEVRQGTIVNTTDGTAAIDSGTTFANIFGAGMQDGDTIRINGTTHEGSSITSTFVVNDVASKTVGDLLTEIRSIFNGKVSASVDAEGRIVVTDNQVGPSSLTVTLIEENEGGGSLNFGSIDVTDEGRFTHEITASNKDGRLFLEHTGFGSRNGFSLSQSLDQLGLEEGDFEGIDVQGSINGEEADGFGRILSGKIGSETVEGLSLRVTLSSEELAETGSELGNVNLIYGVARQLGDTLNFITDEFDGSLKNREGAIDDTIQDLDDQILSRERRIELMRINLVNKFAALEGSLASLQSQGNFLTSHLAGLAAN